MRKIAPKARCWQGATVVCIASGPSLSLDQIELVSRARAQDRCRVIAVNDNWKIAPFADVLYACDLRWWGKYHTEVSNAKFGGELWSCSNHAHKAFATRHIKVLSLPGLSKSPGIIHHGQNSGYQAIGLAHEFGAARIVLIGFDMQHTNGRTHWFGDHPPGFTNSNRIAMWVGNFDRLAQDLAAAGTEVINCSIETALSCFRRDALENIL